MGVGIVIVIVIVIVMEVGGWRLEIGMERCHLMWCMSWFTI
jgi:hypothetical protein